MSSNLFIYNTFIITLTFKRIVSVDWIGIVKTMCANNVQRRLDR
jgi:hypothetical protein